MPVRIGILALQGDVREHAVALDRLGVFYQHVRKPAHLELIDAIILPGGESTTIGKLLHSSGLFEPLHDRLLKGMPAFGTCAGAILLAAKAEEGVDPKTFGVLDMTVVRNAWGRQVDSFETDIDVVGFEHAVRAVFIRAPKIITTGSDIDVLAVFEGSPVAVRSGPFLATTFHPELSGDTRLHADFVQRVSERVRLGV